MVLTATKGARHVAMALAIMIPQCTSAEFATLASFEPLDALRGWSSSGAIDAVAMHASEGDHAMHVRWVRGRGSVVLTGDLNVSGWQELRIDLYNPGPPVLLSIDLTDVHGRSASSRPHYARSDLSTAEVVFAAFSGELDLEEVASVRFRLDPPASRPIDLYLDNLRLARDEPPLVYPAAVPRQMPRHQAQSALPFNGDFEMGFLGWSAVLDEGNGLYRLDCRTGPEARSGNVAAALVCVRVGRAQLTSAPFEASVSGTYRLQFDAAATLGGQIGYGLCINGADAVRTAGAGPDWRSFAEEFSLEAGDIITIQLQSLAPGTVLLDGVGLVAPGETPAAAVADRRPPEKVVGNLIPNPGFEQGFSEWNTWGEWDGGLYEFTIVDDTDAHSGNHAAGIVCVRKGRGGVFSRPVRLESDEYSLTFMARSGAGSTARFGLVYPGGRNFQDVRVGPDWEQHSLSASSDRPGVWRVYLTNSGEGDLVIDDVSLVSQTPVPAATPTHLGPDPAVAQGPWALVDGRLLLRGQPFYPLGWAGDMAPSVAISLGLNTILGADASRLPRQRQAALEPLSVLPDLTGVLRAHAPQQIPYAIERLGVGPPVAGWCLVDDPADPLFPVSPAEVRLADALAHQEDRARITCLTLAPTDADVIFRYANAVDILVLNLANATGLPADLPAKIPALLGTARRARTRPGPVWLSLPADEADPMELQAAAYSGVVARADGLLFSGLDDSPSTTWSEGGLADVLTELRSVEPVLAGGQDLNAQLAAPGGILVRAKRWQGRWYIFAVNATREERAACRIAVPPGATGVATVLFEDRDMSVSDGSLQDDFGPFQRHVYQISSP